MLNKFFCLTIALIFFSLNLEAKNEQTIQIVANEVITKGNIITAKGDILIFSPSYYITAQKAIYDKNTSTLELFENVNVSKNSEVISLSNYAFLDMKNEVNSVSPVLIIDKKTNIWINAKKVIKKSDLNIMKNATLSSCECYDPAWSIGFYSGDYNTTKQWVNLYGTTLYVKDIPAWYFMVPAIPYVAAPHLLAAYLILNPPYFGFPTSKERRSGLLRPKFGYGSEEGYFFMQPIFYDARDDLDFEYIPQARSLRGVGHELKMRYKDSRYSQLDISYGQFKEKDSYFKENDFTNQKHFGWNLNYERNHLFSSKNNKDGLLISLQDMNDIEYKNTKYMQTKISSDQIIESNIKYFYNTNSFYGDIETKYFNNIVQDDNDNVMQILPQIQFHKYSYSFLFDSLLSSYDIKYSRKTRVDGIGANTTNINIPFTYSTYLFDKLIGVSFSEQFNYTNINYSNTNIYKDGNYLENSHIISADLDLIKPYDSFIHSINFNTTYTKPHTIKTKGDIYGINNNDSTLNLFPVTSNQENLNFSINQNIYDKDSLKAIISHKINQSIVYDENRTIELANLENELTFNFTYGSLSNRLVYNHKDKMIISSTYALKLKKDNLFSNIDYSYSKNKSGAPIDFSYRDLDDLKSITGEFGAKVFKYYTIKYKEQYDIIEDIRNIKEYNLIIDKKCWKLDIKLADNLVAAATSTNNARRQNIIYATITLKPIVSYQYVYEQDEKEVN